MALPASSLADIHAAFALPVTWRQEGEAPVECTAVPFHDPGDRGFGRSVGRKGFEVPKELLPFEPENDDIVVDGTDVWRVIEVINYREANAWRVFVEEAES